MVRSKAPVVWLFVSLAPYRSSVCVRIRREIPEIELFSGVTDDPREIDRWPAVSQEELPHTVFHQDGVVTAGFSPHAILRNIAKGRRVLKWLGQVRPRAVIIHGYNDATRLMTVAWCVATGTQLMVSADSNIKDDRTTGIKRLAKSAYLRSLLRCVTAALPFGSMGALYFQRYGLAKSRIFHFPAEPNYDLISHDVPPVVASVAARYRLKADRRRLVYSGRLVSPKRVDLLVQAFMRIAPDHPDLDLIILGTGPERNHLEQMAQPLFSERVKFIAAIQNPVEVFAVCSACDVLVLPSDYEPWALVINEAAAAGLAIVCSDVVGAAADLVKDGVNGRVFRTGDVDDLVRALRDVCEAANLDRYKAASPGMVAEWRRKSDPVNGLRSALKFAGVIESPVPSSGTPGEG